MVATQEIMGVCSSSSDVGAIPVESKKWQLLQGWAEWSDADQFGNPQPAFKSVVGPDGRTKFGDQERPHPYEVAISFPGASFGSGKTASGATPLLDENGNILAESGTALAEAMQHWLVEDWLEGNADAGTSSSQCQPCEAYWVEMFTNVHICKHDPSPRRRAPHFRLLPQSEVLQRKPHRAQLSPF
jgi:hypothetical protein